MTTNFPRPNRAQSWLIGLAVASYAVGYPAAILAEWVGGWFLVSLGGIFLLALGVVTIRRIGRSDEGPGPTAT